MINLQGVEGNLSWIYILIRKIDGAVLPTILKADTQSADLGVRNPTGHFNLSVNRPPRKNITK